MKNVHGVEPTRFMKRKESDCAIKCNPDYGPIFGNYDSDIYIVDNCNRKNNCFIFNDGSRGYDCHPEFKSSLFVNTAGLDKENCFSVLDDLDAINYKDSDIRLKISQYYFKNPSKFLPGTQLVDIQYDSKLREWCGDCKWKLLYRSSEHGYTAESFHEYCDNVKGPTLIVINSSGGWIFGGYTTKSWS